MLSRSISAHGGCADAPGQAARLDLVHEPLALAEAQRLGVADPGDLAGVRPDEHGGRDDGRAQRAHADLVDAHDATLALQPEGMLGAQVWLAGRHAPS